MISKEFANSISSAIFGKQNLAVPNIWYFGITTADIVDGVIPAGAEPTNLGYSRTAIPNNLDSFSLPQYNDQYPLSYVTNKISIVMSPIEAGDDINATNFFLSSSPSGNSAEIWGRFSKTYVLPMDSQLVIEPNGAIFELLNA